jgi:integrase/recombinase XerD
MELEEYLLIGHSRSTVKSYLRGIKLYQDWREHAADATHNTVMDYVRELRLRYHKASTLHGILSCVKAYYRYLNYIGYRKDNPARSIRLRDKRIKEIQLQDLFSVEELERIFKKGFHKSSLHGRNKVLISFLVYQGLQAVELECLKVEDIDLEKGTVYIRSSRISNGRTLTLTSQQIMLLYVYMQEDRPVLLQGKEEDSLLLNHEGKAGLGSSYTSYIRRRYKKMFQGRSVSITTIRQSVITNLLKTGHDLRIVQVFAGHRCPSTTEKYKQSYVEALQKEIDRYHPIR